jgi:hypothetical protein
VLGSTAASAQDQRTEWKVTFHAITTSSYCFGFERGIVWETKDALSILDSRGKFTFVTVPKGPDGSVTAVEVDVNDVRKHRWRVTAAAGNAPGRSCWSM